MQFEKKLVLFGLEDTLVPGNVETKFNMKPVYDILENLKTLSVEKLDFHFGIVSGLPNEFAMKKINEFKLDEFFEKEMIFTVDEQYLNLKSEEDRQIYDVKISQNPQFKDEYFKQKIIQSCLEKFSIQKKQAAFIGHDIWTEGFYTMRFSGIDFVLISSSYSHSDKLLNEKVQGINYIQRRWSDVEKLIMGKFPDSDYSKLNKYVHDKVYAHLFDGQGLVGKVKNQLQKKN